MMKSHGASELSREDKTFKRAYSMNENAWATLSEILDKAVMYHPWKQLEEGDELPAELSCLCWRPSIASNGTQEANMSQSFDLTWE